MFLRPLVDRANASALTGAFFLLVSLASCDRNQSETASWVGLKETAPPAAPASTPEAEVPSAKSPSTNDADADAKTPISQKGKLEGEICFLSYNLKNYLTMRRGSNYSGKPEEEIEALIDLIVAQKPDILGVSEIGTEKDLLDLQSRLASRGVKLNHHEHTGGADKTRHLGLLSRFPIVERHSQRELSYELTGETRTISRGILDATIDTGSHELRMLGVHLKSKRPVDYADQDEIRQNEAHLVRAYATEIMTADPEVLLLTYGDFNDTIGSKTLQIMRGRRNSKINMPDHYFKDSRGHLWTHFWDYQDVYSRFDYVLFSDGVRPLIDAKASGIVEDPGMAASDHRALRLILKQ